ncbi:MAG: ferritin-like domain-containing protein [Ginsengibacter sp.]
MPIKTKEDQPGFIEGMAKPVSRRNFFGIMGAGTAIMVAGASCHKVIYGNHGKGNGNHGINLGSGDIGILNYAYALEQLEAAFYTKIISSPYKNISWMEKAYLTDIRDHEIAHREFFKAALSSMAIPALEVNFSSIDFSDRTSVLGTAKAFEDLGVSAYNGAGQLITNPDYLTIAGKIVSVEARHAAWIRDMIMMNSFADSTVLDMNGLDVERKPNDVLAIAGTYLKSKLDASNLPTN